MTRLARPAVNNASARSARSRGFTLVELVTAAAVFSLLGLMLFNMVRGGMTLWKEGEAGRNEMDRAAAALDLIAGELRHAFTVNDPLDRNPVARLQCDAIGYDLDGNGVFEGRVQRLCFTRIDLEERENDALRAAGDHSLRDLDAIHATLFDQPGPATLPTSGLAEAVFMAYPAPDADRAGLLSLYRGYRAPPGGEESFFAPGRLERPEEIRSRLLPILDGVLHLEFRFWNQNTQTFDPDQADPDLLDGAGYTWDSTRAVLPEAEEGGPNAFVFGLRETSFEEVSDDLFPRWVRVSVIVVDPLSGEEPPRLVSRLQPEDLRFTLDAVRPFVSPVGEARFLRIDGEWIEYQGVEEGEIVVYRRGARGTAPAEHPAGSLVWRGRAFSTLVEIPAAAACWNEEG